MWIAVALLLLCSVASAQVPEGWFEFTVAVPAEGSIVDLAGMNPPINDRPVRIEDGRFVDGRGEPIRFLGTNLTFSDAFPDKERAPEIARRMAALGMNVVRFHHLDNSFPPSGIWDPNYEAKLHLDPGQLDRLDWMIYQLKQHGIYTNLNLHVSRTLGEAEGFPNVDQTPSYNKGIDNFEPRMIALQKEYARDLLTHVNPYTGNAYTDEPCVAMVEITNEDSALRFAMGSTFERLPEPYASTLQGLWMDWLRERYATTAALREAWDEGSEPLGEEMLRNPDFTAGTEQWELEAPPPAKATMEVVEDPERGRVLYAELTEPGLEAWHFQIHQTGHTLEDGRLYTVSFAARAEPERDIHVNIRYDIAPWSMAGLNRTVHLTEDWQQFRLTFRADDPLPEHTRLSFNCVNELGKVWFDDISLRPGGLMGLPEGQSLEDGVAFPTSGSTEQARRDWFAFVIELERRYTLEMYDYLKNELGVQAHVIDTQATYGGPGGVLRESRMDYADVHAYWQHPRFPGRPWDRNNWLIPNSPMTAAFGRDTLTNLSRFRLAGKPYTVSEYNHPAPNDYRAECMPMLATWGGLQSWSGLFQFCYGSHPDDWSRDAIDSYFAMSGDPASLVMFPVAANLFRRGDVPSAASALTLSMPADLVPELIRKYGNSMGGVWEEVGVSAEMALANRLAVEVPDGGVLSLEGRPRESAPETGVRWSVEDDTGVFTVDTERTKVALGAIAGQTVELGGVSLEVGETSNGHAHIALTSMDGRPIAESERMLLVAVNRVENQQMGWNEERTTVGGEWGHGPTIAEAVPLTLRIAGRDDLRIWPLDGEGNRRAPADGLTVGADQRTLWYEVGAQ